LVIVGGFLCAPYSRVQTVVSDSVAVDAKRILLRYGAPIAVLDKVTEADRIEFAREIAKTSLPDRQPRLREILIDKGYIVVEEE
jgi:bifunctional DNase/RNase